MNELVTAVITTYKREPEILRRAVESVVNQSWRPLELLVVNDCPEDSILSEKIRKMLVEVQQNNSDVAIQYVPLERNSGACAARNRGLELANGEYISYLDDDDVWKPNKLELQRAGFISDKIGMVYSPFINISYKNPEKEEIIIRGDKSGNLLENLLERNVIGGTSMPMIRTEALRLIDGFDESLQSSQDYDVWIRIAQRYEIQFVEKPLTIRYMTEDSITTNLKKKEQGWQYFTDKYWNYYETRNIAFQKRVKLYVKDLVALGEAKVALNIIRKYNKFMDARIYIDYGVAIVKEALKRALRLTRR